MDRYAAVLRPLGNTVSLPFSQKNAANVTRAVTGQRGEASAREGPEEGRQRAPVGRGRSRVVAGEAMGVLRAVHTGRVIM